MNDTTRPILVCSNGTTPATTAALRFAEYEADLRDVGIEAALAPQNFDLALDPHDLMVGANGYGVAGTRSADESGRSPIPSAEIIGSPEADLGERAADAALAVIGSTADTLSAVLGSRVVASILDARCPVAVIPLSWTPVERRLIAAAVDETETSRRAADFAATEAELRAAPLELFHAQPHGSFLTMLEGQSTAGPTATSETPTHAHIGRLRAANHRAVITTDEIDGSFHDAVHDVAARADLLVVGRWRHRGRPHWAAAVSAKWNLRGTSCPLVIVP
ncbi:universal stress protein [Gordonia sp. TBRC 11910]|uniref:Universal stress protein n=1 Tax=Gordonia asplenii TaxID=2725283 RepID=A0A848KXM6_9ACTN|nr:universal stress protein [Gordonia asplenii]NMO01605.1 universal stress protein [Gordonia asplenii]